MNWLSRSARAALMAYVLLAVLILGSVTWGTVTTLKLERKYAEDRAAVEHRNLIKRALLPMEWAVMGTIVQEAARRYSEYSPRLLDYDSPWRIRFSDGSELTPDAELERDSPLLDAELEPWMRVHFQVSPNNKWQSPQVPDEHLFGAAKPGDAQRRAKYRGAFEELKTACVSYDLLAERLAAAHERDRKTNRSVGSEGPGAEPWAGTPRAPQRTGKTPSDAYVTQRAFWTQQLQQKVPREACEPSGVARRNLGESIDESDERYVPVELTRPTALWLECDPGQRQLAWVREATIEGAQYFQGILVDWPLLKETLLAETALPHADLVPVEDPTPEQMDRMMISLPAALQTDPPSPAAIGWSPTRLLLLGTWLAALSILGAVGLGMQSLLALTDRRTQFAYAVTHELRTPLTTLRLYTDMLAAGLVKPDQQQRYLTTLHSEVERLSNLVNEVLEYARVENRTVQLHRESIRVADLLQSIDQQCRARCEREGKSLVIEADGLAAENLSTDPQLVRQIVSTLIDNACKYAKNAHDPTITVRAVPHFAGNICVDVEDGGPGVSADDRQRIFKPFRRGRGEAAQTSSGIGLGLALARSWTHLLGGRLELLPNEGTAPRTCFRLTIPRR